MYKQRNTPKQTRLRKALLHYFWRSLRRKGQQGSAIVSALKIGFASHPIFFKVMLSSDKKWIIALTRHCFVCRFTNALTRRDLYTAQAPKNPRKIARVAKPKFDKSQSNHKAPPESPYPVTKVSCQILIKYFMMLAPESYASAVSVGRPP